jgi:hypothetical protein
MKHKILTILITLLLVFLFANCSEVKDDITKPAELEGVHPDGFGKLGSDNFHSLKFQTPDKLEYDFVSKMSCF